MLPSSRADITDVDLFLKNLNSALFPGISSNIECHSGFTDEQELYELHLNRNRVTAQLRSL